MGRYPREILAFRQPKSRPRYFGGYYQQIETVTLKRAKVKKPLRPLPIVVIAFAAAFAIAFGTFLGGRI